VGIDATLMGDCCDACGGLRRGRRLLADQGGGGVAKSGVTIEVAVVGRAAPTPRRRAPRLRRVMHVVSMRGWDVSANSVVRLQCSDYIW
jgi:hypothetical protein